MPQAAYPGTMRAAPLLPYLALLRVGFTMPPSVATDAVRSYRTISPLPARRSGRRRYAFCCTFRRLTPPRGYLALCPMEPGLSSPSPRRRSDCLADSAYYYIGAVCTEHDFSAVLSKRSLTCRPAPLQCMSGSPLQLFDADSAKKADG